MLPQCPLKAPATLMPADKPQPSLQPLQGGHTHRLRVMLKHFNTGVMMELWKPLGANPRH